MISIQSATRLALASSFILSLASLVGCGGFSEEEATARCDQERAARGEQGCFGNVEYGKCKAAYEECGEDVTIVDGCPIAYNCPVEDVEETAAE
jgi:hypothetical protein